MVYNLAPVGFLNSALHTNDEAGAILKHVTNRLLDQLLRVLAVGRGCLLRPPFNVG
jgi:hypothetical protein